MHVPYFLLIALEKTGIPNIREVYVVEHNGYYAVVI